MVHVAQGNDPLLGTRVHDYMTCSLVGIKHQFSATPVECSPGGFRLVLNPWHDFWFYCEQRFSPEGATSFFLVGSPSQLKPSPTAPKHGFLTMRIQRIWPLASSFHV